MSRPAESKGKADGKPRPGCLRKLGWLLFIAASLLAAVYLGYKIASPYIWPLPFDGPNTGRVIDAETGSPIARAKVEARWMLHDNPLPDGSGHYLVTQTDRTDENGVYRISRPFRRRGFFGTDFSVSAEADGYVKQAVIHDPNKVPLPQSTLDYPFTDTSTRPSMPPELEFRLKPAGPVLVRALVSAPEGWLRMEAATRLANAAPALADSALPALGQALADEDEGVREYAAAAMGAYGDKASDYTPLLAGRLTDPAQWVRVKAAEALGKIGPPAAPAVPALAGVLLEDPERMVRKAAAEALGRMGPAAREALPALRQALSDPEGFIDREAARAIELIEGEGPDAGQDG